MQYETLATVVANFFLLDTNTTDEIKMMEAGYARVKENECRNVRRKGDFFVLQECNAHLVVKRLELESETLML